MTNLLLASRSQWLAMGIESLSSSNSHDTHDKPNLRFKNRHLRIVDRNPASSAREIQPESKYIDRFYRELQATNEHLRKENEMLLATQGELHAQHDELTIALAGADEERLRYHDLFELAPDAYLVTDAKGLISEANTAATELFGWNANRLAGAQLGFFICDHHRTHFHHQLDHAFEGRVKLIFQADIETRDGFRLPVSFTATPSVDQVGETVRLRWLLRGFNSQHRSRKSYRSGSTKLRRLPPS